MPVQVVKEDVVNPGKSSSLKRDLFYGLTLPIGGSERKTSFVDSAEKPPVFNGKTLLPPKMFHNDAIARCRPISDRLHTLGERSVEDRNLWLKRGFFSAIKT